MARPVVVEIHPEVADRVDVQHTAALLVNLLARSKDYVTTIRLDCGSARLRDGVVPPAVAGALGLRDALLELAAAVGTDAVPVTSDAVAGEIRLKLGPGAAPADGWRVHGASWRGVATRSGVADDTESDLPFGPYVAACLAATAVCWITRGKDWRGEHLELSAWDLASASTPEAPTAAGPQEVEIAIDIVLAGIGAVGTAVLYTLWACGTVSGAIVAADDDHVDETNRNRCVLFFARDIGRLKADIVSSSFPPGQLCITSTNSRAESLISPTTHLVSAVDGPESRNALQQRYPASIIQASTDNVRVEMLRCDPTIPTACLRCYNPPRPVESDDQLRRRFRSLSDRELAARAEALHTNVETLRDWMETGRCSEVTGRLLTQFRTQDSDEHAFSIGFGSMLAGVLLAAQTVKDALFRAGRLEPGAVPLHGAVARARFPLLDLGSPAAGAAHYRRDPNCPACAPQAPASDIWRRRFRG